MAAVEIPSTAINIPNAGVPSSLFATKRKRGRPQKKKINGSNSIENLDDILSSSPDSKEPKLSLDVDQRRVEDFLPVAPLSQNKSATSSVEASSSSSPSSSTSVSTPSSASLEPQKNLSESEGGSKSGDSSTAEQPKAPLSPKQLRKKKAKAKAKAKKATTVPTTAAAQQQQQDDSQLKDAKQEVAESIVVQPQPKLASPPVGVLKQPSKELAASAASEKSEENASPILNIQWKIKLSIVEGIRKYVVEKQALPCFERPSILNCAKLPQVKEVEGQWFIVRQDRSFSKPLPAQLENIAKTRETRQTNQKSYTKSRPPSMPKKGQLIIECSVSGNQSDDIQPEQLTYVRNIAFDSGITTTGAKTNLHLHCPAADNGAQDIVIVGAKSGCVHAISLFIPSSDLTPSWQRLLKSHSADDEEESNDEESSSPLMKKRREDQPTNSKQSEGRTSAGKEQDSPSQKRRKVVWAEDVNVRYYIGPASTKKFTKKHKNLQLDRCADVKIKCSDKVAKKKGANYKFQQLELQAVPGVAGSPPASPPLKSARTGSPPPPSAVETASSTCNEDEEVNIVDDDVNTDSSMKTGEEDVHKEKEKDVASIEPTNSESSQDSTEVKRSTTDERRQEKAIDECSLTERKTEESSLS